RALQPNDQQHPQATRRQARSRSQMRRGTQQRIQQRLVLPFEERWREHPAEQLLGRPALLQRIRWPRVSRLQRLPRHPPDVPDNPGNRYGKADQRLQTAAPGGPVSRQADPDASNPLPLLGVYERRLPRSTRRSDARPMLPAERRDRMEAAERFLLCTGIPLEES